ncbi:hypothetical protein CPC735_020690 [Coccidioides posadasii C735 delta SOWgp]|uniref:Uncharacterized protein n=1 Tax=Coccidioides posadasii (strain C735) TaxID=222929 RepID=C5PJ92_COCP7|nr:hypothetical protein CPC735_020690 [Coccidioides posadasii C735 delta SOWgp]EER23041.1 hypothetical protein CPC735_020690 [Coccidioides posadasii C735 delta SOWgp]|eukprot:XP_003065186.1 hypothetical protein CPC735_020690 [Coccidioides posadasii C735 delta SOWgp]
MIDLPSLGSSLTPPGQDWTASRLGSLNTYQLLLSKLEHRLNCTMKNTSDAGHAPQTPGSRTSKRTKRLEAVPGTATLSSGLTPHISRTRLIASSPTISTGAEATRHDVPRGKHRRHTTPYPQASSRKRKLGEPSSSSPTQDVRSWQFIPFNDIIDPRTRRRIGRSGFSEEMNAIEERRRLQRKLEKEKDDELRMLRDELDRLRNERVDISDMTGGGLLAAEGTVVPLAAFESDDDMGCNAVADAFESVGDCVPDIPCVPVLIDAGTQVSFHSCRGEVQSLKEDLERRKVERRNLFREWQGVMKPTDQSGERNDIETTLSTPPPDLAVQVIASLRDATTRASEAAKTVETVQKELSDHGFDGIDAMEVITNIGARFRHARIELERAVPGETPNANLSNWSATIDALVERIARLVADLKKAQAQITGYQERETALRRQFDTALLRFEEASKKNESLERYTETVAEDMLNARMKLQSLGKELQDHAIDKNRLAAALEDYMADVKMLERLNAKLEDEIAASKRQVEDLEIENTKLDEKNELTKARIASLEKNLSHEQDLCEAMQSTLEQCDGEISNLRERIQQLETEHELVESTLREANAKESEKHEKEVGSLNVRLSSISTALDSARLENERLEQQKRQLERRLADFQGLFSMESIQAAQEKARETLKAFEQWQKGIESLDDTSRKDELTNEQAHSFCTNGSEPITPAAESRFKNVEVGRGKKRKRNMGGQFHAVREEEEWSDGDPL